MVIQKKVYLRTGGAHGGLCADSHTRGVSTEKNSISLCHFKHCMCGQDLHSKFASTDGRVTATDQSYLRLSQTLSG